MRINVTQEDIKKGVPGSEDCCAIALAYKRAMHEKWPYQIRITPSTLTVIDDENNTWKSIVLPNEAVKFIRKYDVLKPKLGAMYNVLPFSFDIEELPIPGPDDNGDNFVIQTTPEIGFPSDSDTAIAFIEEMMTVK